MKTIFVVTVIIAGWVGMAVDAMSRNDEHMMHVMACMKRTGHERHVSPQEAYIICEKEDR